MSGYLSEAFNLENLKEATGYKSRWAQKTILVDLEKIVPNDLTHLLPTVDGNNSGILNYNHLSVVYNSDRKLPFFSAYNIGPENLTVKRTSFKKDDRILHDIQLSKDFYDLIPNSDKDFEIGHMAAHDEMAWGEDAQLQAYRTFFFPNSCPQVKRLNAGLWRGLEQYFIKEAKEVTNKKAHIFTGPVLKANDPDYTYFPSFKLPLYFFKVVVFEYNGELKSTGFIMSQKTRLEELGLIDNAFTAHKLVDGEEDIPFMDYNHKEIFQVDITFINNLTGLNFRWSKVRPITVPDGSRKLDVIAKVTQTGDIKLAPSYITVTVDEGEVLADSKIEVSNFLYN